MTQILCIFSTFYATSRYGRVYAYSAFSSPSFNALIWSLTNPLCSSCSRVRYFAPLISPRHWSDPQEQVNPWAMSHSVLG